LWDIRGLCFKKDKGLPQKAMSYFCAGWTVEGLLEKMNIERPTSNVECEKDRPKDG